METAVAMIEPVTKCENCPFREQDGSMVWCFMGGTIKDRTLYEDIPSNCPLLKEDITVKYRNHEG